VKNNNILEGKIPDNKEQILFWREYAKELVSKTNNSYLEFIKLLIQLSSTLLTVFLAFLAIVKDSNKFTSNDNAIIFITIFLFASTLLMSILASIGSKFEFNLSKPNEIELWHMKELKVARRRVKLIVIMFICSFSLMIYFISTLLF